MIPRILAVFLLGVASLVGANLPPELFQALPDVTLARGATADPIPLASHLRDPDVPGTAVRITVRFGSETRAIDLALFDAQTPLTVANFVAYVKSGRYAANFFHRSVPGFIIQNGGFKFLNDTTFDYVTTYASILNEPGISNLRGTIAMAKLGPAAGQPPTPATINSATSQWFINLADNSANLDAQNGGFTVFGRVLGNGLQVADAIAGVTRYDASSYAAAWTDLPLTTGVLARANFIETDAALVAPLSFQVTSDNPALVAATLTDGVLTLSAANELAGTTTVRLTATDLEGAAVTTSFTVVVRPSAQSLTFPAIADRTYGDAPLALTATTSSGLPATITVVSGPATFDGTRLTLTGAGTVLLRATQAGNELYAPATPVDISLVVAKAAQTLSFPPPGDHLYGDAPFALGATASSGLPVVYSILTAPLVTIADGIATLAGVGQVTLRASQPGDANHEPAASIERSFVILAHPSPSISLPAATLTYNGRAQPAVAVTSPAGLNVTYTYKLGKAAPTATVPKPAGTYTVTATLNDPRATGSPSATGTLVIARAPLTATGPTLQRPVDQPNPALEIAYAGFVNGETAAVLDKKPVVTTKASAKSAAGTYPVTVSGGTDANYTITCVPGSLTLFGFGGSYEALLVDENSALLGKLELTVPANALAFTGTLRLAAEARPVVLSSSAKSPGTALLSATPETATLIWTRTATATLPALRLAVTFAREAEPFKDLVGTLTRGDAAFARVYLGSALYAPPSKTAVSWNGQYTLLFQPPAIPYSEDPVSDATAAPLSLGSGYATAPIAPATGVLKLTGRLADNSILTASLKPTNYLGYMLWATPYGTRLDSFLGGYFAGQPHPYLQNRIYVPDNVSPLTWKKAALPAATPESKRDKSYRAGFGPLTIPVNLDPWLPPTKGLSPVTLAQRLGLAADNTTVAAFGIDYLTADSDPVTPAQIDALPAALELELNGKPVLPASNPSKFSLSLSPADGTFSGSFALSDPVPAPTKKDPAATKPFSRKVSFQGILRQPSDPLPATDIGGNGSTVSWDATPPVGQGFFLLPALPGAASPEQPSGEIRLIAPETP